MELEASSITGASLVFTICLCILLLMLPRRYALIPLFISGCYMTLGQVAMIGPLHFSILRILLFVGWVRIITRGELSKIKLTVIDKVLVAWVIVGIILFALCRGPVQELVGRLGEAYNTLGIYFLIRALVRDVDDIVRAVKILAVIIFPLTLFFAMEHITGRNPFSVLGGVPAVTEIREGSLRCQGPFRHPILAGTFGATAMPLFVGLWLYNGGNRRLAVTAAIAATTIVITSSSSGPLIAYITGLVGLFLWHYKSKIKFIFRGIIASLLILHLIMKAPVWFLIARVGDLIGGSGWYRAALIDAAIQHFNEWWLMGTAYTAHWMPTGLAINVNSADITNQFISEGVNGGIVELFLFIFMLVECFKVLGSAMRNEHKLSPAERYLIWSIGCALLGHVASFFSVSYFDQITIFLYLIVAMSATLGELNISVSAVRVWVPDSGYYSHVTAYYEVNNLRSKE